MFSNKNLLGNIFTNLTTFILTLYWIAGEEVGGWNTFTTFVDNVHIHGADRQKERGNARADGELSLFGPIECLDSRGIVTIVSNHIFIFSNYMFEVL